MASENSSFVKSRPPLPRRVADWVGVGLPTIGVLFYALAVIWFVATMGDTGLRCVFGPRVKELASSNWSPEIRLDVAPDLKGREAPTRWSPGPPRATRPRAPAT